MPISINDFDQDDIERAKHMDPAKKLLAGGDLFDAMVERMTAGIRMQHPDADQHRVRLLLRQRLALARRLENQP